MKILVVERKKEGDFALLFLGAWGFCEAEQLGPGNESGCEAVWRHVERSH